jgi:O-antigen ligase
MSATNAGSVTLYSSATAADISAIALRPARVHWKLFFSVVACVGPAMTLVGLGYPYAGAVYVIAALACFLGYRIVMRDHYGFMCIGLGAVPVLALLRGLFAYNSCIFIFIGGILLWLSQAPEELKKTFRDRIILTFFLLAVIYWWLSYLNTGEYANNLRLVELVLAAIAVKLISGRRSYLATAFMGLALSTSAIALGMLPQSDIRLGAADIDGTHLGNPIELGVPAVFVLLLILSDRGQWLFLERRFWTRVFLAVVTGEWLILSGSRGSWLAALAAIAVLMLLNRGDRRLIVVLGAGMVIVTALALTTPLGEKIQTQYDKTVDSDRTLVNRTSGRSAQWAAIPLAFAESPVWGWGPGTGRKVVAYYTGRTLNWHALYLHIAAETGSIGLTALFGLLIAIGRRTIRNWRAFGEITPILALIVYVFLGFSVSAFDANCGILLGMAMMGADFAPRYQLVEATIRELEPAI